MRPSEAIEAAKSSKYSEVRSYLSKASVYEVRHIIKNVPHYTLRKKYCGPKAIRGQRGCL